MIRNIYFDIMKRYNAKLISESQMNIELQIMEIQDKINFWQTKMSEAMYYITKHQEKINRLKLKLDKNHKQEVGESI